MSFPCASNAQTKGMANFTVAFNTTGTLPPNGDSSNNLLNKVVTITGSRICNCTTCRSNTPGGGDSEGINSTVFYVVAAVVVVVILAVIGLTTFCHCYMANPMRKKKAEEEIE